MSFGLTNFRPLLQFWSAYVPCSSQHLDSVQLALEQIDLIRRLVNKHPESMVLVTTAEGGSFPSRLYPFVPTTGNVGAPVFARQRMQPFANRMPDPTLRIGNGHGQSIEVNVACLATVNFNRPYHTDSIFPSIESSSTPASFERIFANPVPPAFSTAKGKR